MAMYVYILDLSIVILVIVRHPQRSTYYLINFRSCGNGQILAFFDYKELEFVLVDFMECLPRAIELLHLLCICMKSSRTAGCHML